MRLKFSSFFVTKIILLLGRIRRKRILFLFCFLNCQLIFRKDEINRFTKNFCSFFDSKRILASVNTDKVYNELSETFEVIEEDDDRLIIRNSQ